MQQEVAQDDVHKARTQAADLAPASAALVLEQDAMFLDLEEFFVKGYEFRALELALLRELLLGVGKDFFAMSEKIGSQERSRVGKNGPP
jgi:hypothetical protein